MDAREIRAYVEAHFQQGTVKQELAEFRLLGEIAAHLAEMNERADPDSGRAAAALIGSAYKKLRAAGDEMLVVLETDTEHQFYATAAVHAAALWKTARG